MRATIVVLAATGAMLFGQSSQESVKVIRFAHTEAPQDMQEINAFLRYMTEVPSAEVDAGARTAILRGTGAQIAMAEWLFSHLDQSGAAPPASSKLEYGPSARQDDTVRLFYTRHAATVQNLQEIATMVRSVAEIRRLFTYNAPRAIAMRGTAEQMAAADWLIAEVDREQSRTAGAAGVHPLGATGEDLVTVLYAPSARCIQDFQEIATVVRSIADIRRVFTSSQTKAVAVRGTPEQLKLAAWLCGELNDPGAVAADTKREYAPGYQNDVVRVFYLPGAGTVQDFQQAATSIRRTTQIRRAFTYNPKRALVLRGSPDQIALAEQIIKETHPGD